jgi:hypothetical protein
MKIIATFAITSLLSFGSHLQAQDVIIGEALGKSIYANQIQATEGPERADALRAIFIFQPSGHIWKPTRTKPHSHR